MPPTGQIDAAISRLDDSQLSERLKEYGLDVGPINVATRRTYERKLQQLMTGKVPASQYQPVDDDDDDDDDDDGNDGIDESQEVYVEHTEPRKRPAPILSEPPRPYVRDTRATEFSPRIESRPSLPTVRKTTSLSTTQSSSTSAVRKPQQGNSRGFPLWLKLVALVITLILLYLVYINMEPQAVSNIPGAHSKIEV